MRLVAAHAAAPAHLALVRDDELHAGRLADDAAGRLARRARRGRRSAGARRCSRSPRRTTARNAAAARGRARGMRGTNASPIGREALHVGDAAAVQAVVRDASTVERDRCPTAGRRPARRRCGPTARCRRSVALPSRAGSVANRFALRRSSSNVSVVVGAVALEVVAHPVDQREVRIAARRVEARRACG